MYMVYLQNSAPRPFGRRAGPEVTWNASWNSVALRGNTRLRSLFVTRAAPPQVRHCAAVLGKIASASVPVKAKGHRVTPTRRMPARLSVFRSTVAPLDAGGPVAR